MFKKIEVNVEYWWGIAGSGRLGGLSEGTKQGFHSFMPDNNVLNRMLKVRFEQNFAATESFLVTEQLHLWLGVGPD